MRAALSHRFGSGFVAFTLAAGAAACATNAGAEGTGPEMPAAEASMASRGPAVDAASLDRHRPSDLRFFDALRMDGALLTRPPADVRAAAQQSTVVVLARMRDITPVRVVGGLQMGGIDLEVLETLSGNQRPELVGKVIVEFPLGDPSRADESVAALRAALPVGEGIWFLRWQGDKAPVTKPEVTVNTDPSDPRFYGLIHMYAMFMQGSGKVVNPLGEHLEGARPLPGLQSDGERFAKLSELAAHIRALR